jgi:hypothetical protein
MQSRRKRLILFTVIAIGYGAAIVFGLGWWDAARKLAARTELANRSHAAAPSSSTSTPTPPLFPSVRTMTDGLGDTWTPATTTVLLPVQAGTLLTFTASAVDPLGRPLQYKFWIQLNPAEPHILCDWGGPTCTWTAARLSNCVYCPHQVTVAVRVASLTAHRRDACYPAEPCDDALWGTYEIT